MSVLEQEFRRGRHRAGTGAGQREPRGLPAVRGELVAGDPPFYYYCPGRDRAVGWFGQQGLAIIDEGFRRGNGRGHRHFLLRAGPALPAA